MDQKLKQRLVGLAVIFSLAVIFVPMLLDGPEPEMETLEVKIPPSPELVPLPVRVEEKVIELRRQTDDLEPLQPRIVDEDSEPPVAAETLAQGQAKTVSEDEKPELKADRKDDKKTDEKAGAVQSASAATATGDEAKTDTSRTSAATAATTETAPVTPKPADTKKPLASNQAAPKPKAEIRAEARPLPKKSAKPVGGESFIVQLGSFTDRNKAYALRDRVRKLKLAAVFIEKFRAQGSTFYRVRVGPFVTRDKARVVLNKLRAKYNIKGQVMTYEQ